MSDDLKWLNQHFVLLIHDKVADVVTHEFYKIPFELIQVAKDHPNSEDYFNTLIAQKKFKEAIEFLSYDMHHRALAWWGYCCVLSLRKELEQNPAEPRDIADIGKKKPFDIPEWAKEPPVEIDEEARAQGLAQIEEAKKMINELESLLPPEIKAFADEVRNTIYAGIKAETGQTPQEMAESIINAYKDVPADFSRIDLENSPIKKATDEIEEKIEKIRIETVDKIKQSVKFKSKEEIKFQTDNAINAAYSSIIAPSDVNAKNCVDYGNACPDTPEGLLALICFWAYGNLTPTSSQVVKTPPGLAANGFNGLVTMMSLKEGGTLKYNERIEHYLELGREVGYGINNWSDFVVDAPHDEQETNPENSFDGAVKEENIKRLQDELEKKQAEIEQLAKEFKRFTGL